MNPWVAVAALAAAFPPVIFWGRIFWNARARVKEDERKELEREVRCWYQYPASRAKCSVPMLPASTR